MSADKVSRDMVDDIEHYKESPLVQNKKCKVKPESGEKMESALKNLRKIVKSNKFATTRG